MLESRDGVKSKVSLIMQGESDDGSICDRQYNGNFAVVLVMDEDKAELNAFGSLTDPMAFHALKVLNAEIDDISKAFPHAAVLRKLEEAMGPQLKELAEIITNNDEEDEDYE